MRYVRVLAAAPFLLWPLLVSGAVTCRYIDCANDDLVELLFKEISLVIGAMLLAALLPAEVLRILLGRHRELPQGSGRAVMTVALGIGFLLAFSSLTFLADFSRDFQW